VRQLSSASLDSLTSLQDSLLQLYSPQELESFGLMMAQFVSTPLLQAVLDGRSESTSGMMFCGHDMLRHSCPGESTQSTHRQLQMPCMSCHPIDGQPSPCLDLSAEELKKKHACDRCGLRFISKSKVSMPLCLPDVTIPAAQAALGRAHWREARDLRNLWTQLHTESHTDEACEELASSGSIACVARVFGWTCCPNLKCPG
jgi:hypothetical protein